MVQDPRGGSWTPKIGCFGPKRGHFGVHLGTRFWACFGSLFALPLTGALVSGNHKQAHVGRGSKSGSKRGHFGVKKGHFGVFLG